MIETTLVILKPDAVRRALIGQVISRLENTGLKITAMKMMSAEKKIVEEHYKEHQGKSFYAPLLQCLLSGPIIVMAVEGAKAVQIVRKIVGATEPLQSAPGTIRGDFTHINYERSAARLGVIYNLIHASDSIESAERELSLWLKPEDYAAEYLRCDEMYF